MSSTDKFNHLINYIPSNFYQEKSISHIEDKSLVKIKNISDLFTIIIAERDLNLTQEDLHILEEQIEELAIGLYNDGKPLFLKGYMSNGCDPLSFEIVNNKKVELLIWCYGDIPHIYDTTLLRFFGVFNDQMKILI